MCNAQTWEEGGGMLVANFFAILCAQNYFDVQFIVPSQRLIPNTSPAPGTLGDPGGKIHGSCGSTTL